MVIKVVIANTACLQTEIKRPKCNAIIKENSDHYAYSLLGKNKTDHRYRCLISLKPLFSDVFYPTKFNLYSLLHALIHSSYTLQCSLNDIY